MLGSTSVGKVQRPVCERFGLVLQRPMVSSRTPKSYAFKSPQFEECKGMQSSLCFVRGIDFLLN